MRPSYITILILIVVINVFRFYALDEIPYGYHVDEYAAVVSYQCIATEGITAKQEKPGVFIQQGFGTPKPPIYSQLAILWFKVFGFSVASLRALSAFGIILGVLGLFLLGRCLGNVSVGLWSALAASISPWSFVLGRLGFESFYAPVFVIWGLWFFFRRKSLFDDVMVGVCMVGAAYIYPPARVFVPLLMGVLFVYSLKKGMKHQWGMVIPWMILLLIPLIQAQLSGLLSYRINTIIIWQPEYLASIGKTNSWWDLSGIFINHFLKHLNPDYLFFKGDPDYAHSTQRAGILSGLDIIAFGLLTISFMISLWRNSWNSRNIWQPNSRWMIGCLVLFFIGIIPSALTFLDIPNALRMNLSWPFLCLLTGFICANICQYKRWLAVVLLAIVIIYTSTFLKDYFTNYAQRSKGMFSFLTLEQAQQNKDMNDWLDFVATYRGKDYHARYHLMHDLGKTCSESYNMWINVNKILEITNNKPR